jgi:hypothetical protein
MSAPAVSSDTHINVNIQSLDSANFSVSIAKNCLVHQLKDAIAGNLIKNNYFKKKRAIQHPFHHVHYTNNHDISQQLSVHAVRFEYD